MIEALTFVCVGFLLFFSVLLFCSILYFLLEETKIFPAILVIMLWVFLGYHIGRGFLNIL